MLTTRLGDITTARVGAIVNAANSRLMGGGGVDGAIHRAGGPSILRECRAIVERRGNLPTGEAVITSAGDLRCDYVIHTVGPVWTGDDAPEHDRLLASAYTASLELAAAHAVRTIAFPNISCGVYRFPKDRAATVALGAVRAWIAANPGVVDAVEFVCFDRENLELYERELRVDPHEASP